MTKPPHEGVHFLRFPRLRGELQQPLTESGIWGFALCPHHWTGLFNQIFVGTERNIFHGIRVYEFSALS